MIKYEKSPKFTAASLGDWGFSGQGDFSDFSMTGGFYANPPYSSLVNINLV